MSRPPRPSDVGVGPWDPAEWKDPDGCAVCGTTVGLLIGTPPVCGACTPPPGHADRGLTGAVRRQKALTARCLEHLDALEADRAP